VEAIELKIINPIPTDSNALLQKSPVHIRAMLKGRI
jgi:hypothetical protein